MSLDHVLNVCFAVRLRHLHEDGSSHLDVDVCSVPHQKFQAQRPLAGGGGKVQRCKALLVHLVDVST